MNKISRKRGVLIVILLVVISLCNFIVREPVEVSAASKYIKPEEFIKSLVEELKIPIDSNNSYEDAAVKAGIIAEDNEFSSYLTRTEVAVLLNRADEYLYGDTLDPELVTLTLEKRISDINRIDEDKHLDVVKCYLKGFIKGYSNGDYSSDREFRGDKKITRKGALETIKKLKDKSLRAKISPDGQLIRMTKLPKSADKYPYILASYPNEYYDGWKFMFEGVTISRYNSETEEWDKRDLKHYEEYAYPFEIDKSTDIPNFAELKDAKLDTWVEKAITHLETIFNADYRNIDDEWIETLLMTDYHYSYWGMEESKKTRIEKYVDRMKKNKTIIESDKVALDGSTLYYKNGDYHLRTYVRYRINSSDTIYEDNVPYDYNENGILYTSSHPIVFKDFKLGEWKECCFDIALTDYGEGNLGIMYAIFVEPFYTRNNE